MALANPPSLVEHKAGSVDFRFLIFDAPTDSNLPQYIAEFKKFNVLHVVRVCAPTYSAATLESASIKVHDWSFADGASPPAEVLANWRALIKATFTEGSADKRPAIGCHCVAGLGRAPVLVTIALIDAGMDNLAAIELVRSKRRGAINATQLRFLKDYKPSGDKCCLM